MSTFPSSVDLKSFFDNADGAPAPDRPARESTSSAGSGGDVMDIIKSAAERNGVPAELAFKIAGGESSFKPGVKNQTGSSAGGLFQIIDSTWKGMGGSPNGKFDAEENADVGTRLIGKNIDTLKRDLKRNPTYGEVYAAHFFGSGVSKMLASADRAQPIEQGLSLFENQQRVEKILEQNPNLRGKTVGQVLADLNRKVGTGVAQAPAPDKSAPEGKYYEPRQAGKYVDITERKGATAMDVAKEFFASATESAGSIGQFAGEGAAAIANAATGTQDFESKNPLKPAAESIRGSMTEGGKQARESSSIEGSVLDLFKGDAKLPDNVDGWLMMGASGFGSLLTSVLPIAGPAGRVASLTKAARAAELAGDVAKAAELTKAAEAAARTSRAIGAGSGAAMTGGAAADDVRESAAKSVSAMSHEQLLTNVPVYSEVFAQTGDEGQARNAVVNSAARWAAGLSSIAGAAGGAFNAKVVEDFLAKKGMATMLGDSMASRTGRAVVGGSAGAIAEGGQETSEKVGQNIGENIGLGRAPGQDALRDTAGDFVGGALIGSPVGAGGGFISKPSQPAPPNPLQSVVDQAQKPGSVLSRAVVSTGVTDQAAQAAQNTQTGSVDPISARVQSVEEELRANGTLDKMRAMGPQMGADNLANDFLYALQVARDPRSRPDVRQQAIDQVNQAIEWTKTGFTMPQEQPQAPQQPGTAVALRENNAVGPVGQAQFFDPNTIDGEAVRVDNMIGGPRSLPGPQRGLTTTGEQAAPGATPTEAPSAPAAPAAPRQTVYGRAPIDTSAAQQNVGTPTDVSRMAEVPAPRVDIPAGNGPAIRRKRAEVVKQLAGNGFGTVVRDGKDFYMVNQKTGQKFKLDGPADAQLANKAIKDANDAAAHQSPNSPLNDKAPASQAQIDAGNYAKPPAIVNGINLRYENPKGSTRSGVDEGGKPWSVTMQSHYGHDDKVVGADGDKLDFKVGDHPSSPKMYVVDQINPNTGKFDEHKVIAGVRSEDEARRTYLADYEPGWKGLGAITEITKDQYDEWTKPGKVAEPYALSKKATSNVLENAAGANEQFTEQEKSEQGKKWGESGEFFYVSDEGKQKKLKRIRKASLPKNESPRREGGLRPLTQDEATAIERIAALFGKKVVFFEAGKNRLSDGFVKPGNNGTIYVATETTVNPLAIFGHEFYHTLRQTNPEAWNAIAAIVRERVTDAKGFREDYYGQFVVRDADGKTVKAFRSEEDAKKFVAESGRSDLTIGAQKDESLSDENGGELEELVSDLGGKLMMDPDFWADVMAKIEADHGAKSRGIISRLIATFNDFVRKALDGIKQGGYSAERYVKDIEGVRAAFRDGVAKFITETGKNKMSVGAEVKKEEQKLKAKQSIKKSEDRADKPEGLTVEGYHFSKEARPVLTTGMFGTGLKGSARDEIMAHPDQRLRQRLSFYVNKGTGIKPEAGVGGIAHKATLTNIYDADADPLRLRTGDARAFESKVLDAGYSGYLNRLGGTQSGQVILLGNQTIRPEVLGPRTSIEGSKVVPAAAQREMDLGDKIAANKALPSGMLSPSRWSEVLMQQMPAEAAQLMDIGAFAGERGMYKDELVSKIRGLTGQIKKSADRARDEYADVEAKYKGTDAWMKAPDGTASKLTTRQWVQVRTPSFKQWFGDWEAAHANGGVWAADDVSKAVGKNGEPLVVYHGTDQGGFTEFEAPGGTGRGDLGIWTTPDYGMARSYVRKGRARDVDLSLPTQADLEEAGYEFIEEDGGITVNDSGGYTIDGPADNDFKFRTIADAVAAASEGFDGEAGTTPGIYALFINVRNPNEENFEGAMWSGETEGKVEVLDENGDQAYNKEGGRFFDQDEADALLEENPGYEIIPSGGLGYTTDDVVRDALRNDNDGSIIRDVIDDGGGPGYFLDPQDIFVAFDPSQLKSADYNNGEFNDSTGDLRKSEDREYKLDIEREDRAISKSARLTPEEVAAIEAGAKKLNLTAKQTRDLIATARDIKKQYPASAGWAPIEAVGAEAKLDEEGNPKKDKDGNLQIKVKFREIGYSFNKPVGAKRAPPQMDQAWMKKVADKFTDLITGIYSRAEKGDANAQIIVGHQTWYRNVAEVLRREYGAQGDLLADLLGATSPNTPVDTNWRFSIDILRRFVRGEFDADMKKFVKFLDDGGSPSQYPAADKIRQISGKLYGMNSGNAMRAMADMWRVIEPGTAPKARNFALNLIGQSDMATIDVWAARMLRRAANQVRGADLPRIPPVAEKGVTGNWNASATDVTGEFGFGAAVLQRVSKMLERKGIQVSPPDLQAIAWFAEKELWGQKGWTTKTGEGGSFEENIDAFPVERYLAGWSIQQGEKVPEQGDVSVAQARVMSTLVSDDTVVAARVLPTSGLYGGVVEASFDTEWTAVKGQHDPSMAMAEIARLAKENEQYDMFVSKVLGPKEDSPNARPGVEIYFKSQQDLNAAMPILAKFTARGVDGFTMAVDPRAKTKSVAGEQFIGVRLQYVPEISMRWDEQARQDLLAEGGIEKALQEKRELLNDIAAEVRTMEGVAFAAMQNYDTVVVGKENYDEYIDRIAEGGDRAPGSKAWFGTPIRQGLKRAATRLRGDLGQDSTRGVSDAGSSVRSDGEEGRLSSDRNPSLEERIATLKDLISCLKK